MLRPFIRSLRSGPLARQLRRFVAVGAFAAVVQMVLLWLLVDYGALNYLLGATLAIECTIVLQYVINNAWTFRAVKHTGRRAFLTGLIKTNVVRGSAIPIQLAILFLLVEWHSIQYLPANGVAIVLSGIYRFILDSQWTWQS